ncbi:MAG: DUF362 domain-containing protein [Candidatus Omnitrophica bacterium]|nr:DUF362 domain-containing protein [Candidatus Omnitrophota bacterium]MCM8807901.1 DUF362 domain-containing protein [Candidatus Omnitrophota bacterium]
MKRREFIKKSFLFLTSLSLSNLFKNNKNISFAEEKESEIYAAKGLNIAEITTKVIEAMGGISKFVKRGNKVVIKPNIAWNRTPDQCANTNPEVVATIVKLCKKAGAKEIIVMDNPVNPWNVTYTVSGIKEVVEREGGIMKPPVEWITVNIGGEVLKEAEILKEVYECDILIDVPVVKVHSGGVVTIAMKNFMGIVKDRGYFHRTDLHKCIAEITKYILPKTKLIILDAIKVMLTRGPQGPGELKELNMVIGGTDIVALDAYGTTLLNKKPEQVPHIRYAAEMGLGVMDLSKIKIKYV